MPDEDTTFSPRCLSLDLEVGKADSRIHALAGVRADTGRRFVFSGGNLAAGLAKLDDLANGVSFVLGHNLIAFDLPHLTAAKPDLRLLKLPTIDTLRLSPLAFPRNPYHHLVKHYQDGGLKRGQLNDPELDARLALEVFGDQRQALREAEPNLLAAWHWLSTPEPEGNDRALDDFFSELRGSRRPSDAVARAAIGKRLAGIACATHGRQVTAEATASGWALAYSLAWLSVAGGNSVMPPWVRHQFPEAGRLVRRLRDTACTDPACGWCRERHDARKELTRWFGFSDFRPEPASDDGRPMQRSIVEVAMAGEHVLGILPTGTGKSLCYQIPALSRYDKTGALTVVISPLVALMADQVAGMEAQGIGSCVTINGMLSMPERADALDRVRLGDAGILIISPEQLRSRSVRRALDQREIGGWVVDEAHCLSRWGHDFRPDYRYVGRFIREKAGAGSVPPVLCLTATAKPDVTEDLVRHFRDRLGIELTVFNGGGERPEVIPNLTFEVIPTSGGEKFAHIHQILMSYLPPDRPGGAIVYCSATDDTRVRTAVAWLEEAELLAREENVVQVFPSSLRVSSVEEARAKLEGTSVAETYRGQLLRIAEALIEADADEGVTTDELMGVSGLSSEGVRGALYDLERLGIASNDTVLTAFVHAAVERASLKRLKEAAEMETALIAHMREAAPDQGKGNTSSLHLRIASQILRDEGLADPLPERLWRILRSIAYDGRGEDGAAGSLTVRKQDAEMAQVTLQREWRALEETARIRREAAGRLLDHLLACLPPGSRGTDLLAETTLGKLTEAIESDLVLKSKVKYPAKLLDRAGGHPPQQRLRGVPPGHDHPPGAARPPRLRQDRLRAARPSLQGTGPADPRDGGVCRTRSRRHERGAASGDGLFRSQGGGVSPPLVARPGPGDRPGNHARILAGHRRKPEEPRPAAHRCRRPGPDQCAGAGRPGLGQDPCAGTPYRLSGARAA